MREDDPPGEQGLPADEAFSLLGDQYRARIIRTLGEAQGTEGPRPILSFSDLYAAAEVSITTSQFNYHLQKLVGVFVEKVDNGYRLRHEGVELYRTILAGTFTREDSVDSFAVGAACFDCGGDIVARYDEGRFVIACGNCGDEYSDTTAPPTIADSDPEAILSQVDGFVRNRIRSFSRGVCSICANTVSDEFLPAESVGSSTLNRLDLLVHYACDHCGAQQYLSVGLSMLYDAELITFFQNHGLNVLETPIWELEFAMTDRYTTVLSRDPWEVEFSPDCGGETLTLTLTSSPNGLRTSKE